MENHISKLTAGKLSLYGKAILLNTLGNVNIRKNSNSKKIFNYLWQNKNLEPIARKTIFLQKEKGGLNIKETEARNLAMRLKHLLKLKKNMKTNHNGHL